MKREKKFYELMEALYSLANTTAKYESMPRTYGTEDELFMAEAHTINYIGDKVRTNLSEIARDTLKTKGAVSQLLDKLEKKFLISKVRNPSDSREIIISLSEKGTIVYEFHKQLDDRKYKNLLLSLDEYTDQDFENFIQISNVIRIAAEKTIKQETEEKEVKS